MSDQGPDAANEAGADQVTLTLDRSAALVAFDLLARLVEEQEGEALRETLEHPAELASLWALVTAFEQVLPEPFADDYRAVLEKARSDLVDRLATG